MKKETSGLGDRMNINGFVLLSKAEQPKVVPQTPVPSPSQTPKRI